MIQINSGGGGLNPYPPLYTCLVYGTVKRILRHNIT